MAPFGVLGTPLVSGWQTLAPCMILGVKLSLSGVRKVVLRNLFIATESFMSYCSCLARKSAFFSHVCYCKNVPVVVAESGANTKRYRIFHVGNCFEVVCDYKSVL